jgi:ABC-type multidrug transport system fused ATPase/permease subunit
MAEKQSLGSLVSGVTEDISTLLRGEIELVKTEIKDTARTAGKGSGLLVGAGVTAFLGLIFLLLTLAWVLVQVGLPTWAGFGIVTLLLIIVAVVLGLLGRKQLQEVRGPERSQASLAKTKAVLQRGGTPDLG